MRYTFSLILIISAANFQAVANEVDNDIALLDKKIGLCQASIKSKNCIKTEYCKDYYSFKQHILKGDSRAYIEYHIETGDMHQGNIGKFTEHQKKLSGLLKLEISGEIPQYCDGN